MDNAGDDLQMLSLPKGAVNIIYSRDIGDDEVEVIQQPAAAPRSTMPALLANDCIKRLRFVHHQVARALASGMSNVEASLTTGLSAGRISELRGDPSFVELLTFYAEKEHERFASVRDRMVTLGLTASDELLARLAENPDQFSNKELRELSTATLDRGGFAPVKTSLRVSKELPSNAISAVRQAVDSRAAAAEEILDAEYSEVEEPSRGEDAEGASADIQGGEAATPRAKSAGATV